MEVPFPWRFWGGGNKEKQPVTDGTGTRERSEERSAIDEEFDIVVVPSDGQEWCTGWEEPHGAGFRGDEDDGFAVLIPCYKLGCKEIVSITS
ncbi:hypothetical protein F3Y22_tig00112530pilonHSYRG00176 [Hibiscus syriacus]|uniref:Uncharacterized protein n=1 Tax=Hibiscus syriacus TaxID=106335 RepID=A0A6A2XUP1_HIBSY|nr:hypothetical protein F3Y22_tig00112530pilonHSYRG00176 [Hibiscus syriacus]